MATEQVLSKLDMKRIEESYTIVHPDDVRELLERHLHVIPALLEAPAKMKENFGERLRGVVLERVHDPEEDEELLSVMALVRATPEEAFELRTGIDDWWLAQSFEIRLTVAFGVSPV